MIWLFTQMFVLCAGAFLAGALLTWLPMRGVIRRLRAEVVTNRGTFALLPPSLVTEAMVVDREPVVEEPTVVVEAPVEPEVLPIKANSKSRIGHTSESPYFSRMKGDVAFRSVQEAEQAGYTIWSARTRTKVSA